ncbi:MAG: leader peptide processing enzyme [Sphaerochaetaceae bacterium]
MSKKSNTVWFMVLATVLNLVLMLILFFICFLLISSYVDLNSSLVPLWLSLSFIVSIGGSFWLYSVIVKAISKKFNLEDKMAPLFTRRPRKPRPEKE